ncbi:hypothetical protein OSB04_010940 [Centaurea solstitialis]|uniref:TRASH domain-containing protein n=1 Tax=Centaurea solstitialis TaxID=347529 RepID=A0AA38WPQ6_9ASTR|nr:hypothetical protein OSB04_010940 [Centaurea solstitialis]
MRLEKCWFCSSTVYPGHGIQFVRNDAKIFRFCRSKCHKNFKMKRNPRKVKWTKAYRRLHGKDMTQDSTFEFERKRNRPERYDRNLTENTLKAIKTIDKVRFRREEMHHKNRASRFSTEHLTGGSRRCISPVDLDEASPFVFLLSSISLRLSLLDGGGGGGVTSDSFLIVRQLGEEKEQSGFLEKRMCCEKTKGGLGYKEELSQMKGKVAKERREARKEHDQQLHMVVAPGVTLGSLAKNTTATPAKVKVKVQHESAEDNRMEE